jgi:hypothetical protein
VRVKIRNLQSAAVGGILVALESSTSDPIGWIVEADEKGNLWDIHSGDYLVHGDIQSGGTAIGHLHLAKDADKVDGRDFRIKWKSVLN